ncbi:hypothetical protein C0995_010486 [Termitomyces sp. Mi166|nr:hypothetical protein C0995_010486 [Termitomyces sp. Mi166\
MATTRQTPVSPSRFSWLAFGLGFKNASLDPAHESELDDPWYIPYSGPVEPPREPIRHRSERDSWGDPIERDEEGEDTAKVPKPYEVGSDFRHPFAGVHAVGDHSPQTSHRVRTRSAVSGRTDPASMVSLRRLTITSQRLPAPLPASGGVGESPMPPPMHHRTASKERNGTSIAGLFSFGGQTRKRFPSEKEPKLLPKILTKTGLGQPSSGHRRSSSTGSNSFWGGGTEVAGHDDTSYHFSTNVSQKTRSNVNYQSSNHLHSSTSIVPRREQQIPTSSPSRSDTRHPYSYVFPSSLADNGPRTAPLPSTAATASSSTHAVVPTPTFIDPEVPSQKSTDITQVQMASPRHFSNRKEIKGLKNSASTPDLRIGPALNTSSQRPTRASTTIKIKERWLSAETWCDALLFPRPRLKVKKNGDNADVGRIVSLPPSPVNQSGQSTIRASEQGVASRVLVHSRSLADIDKARENPPNKGLGSASSSTRLQPQINSPIYTNRPHRTKSWAFDDLALPTPVPSLAQVLEEGEKFENQRKQWQDQATKSFQNKFTRSISRSRSKSLTHKGRKNDGGRPNNIDFLAARACLGNQTLSPVIAEHKFKSSQVTSFGTGPLTRTSHSRSNSLVRTWSKSPKSHTRSHSRSDSFGGAVLKKAKAAEHGGPDGGEFYTSNELENALKGDGTKFIRLADPAVAPNPTLTPSSPSSHGSLVDDARIGIGATRLPSHPYAQGGLYSFRPDHRESAASDYHVPDSPVEDFSREANNNPTAMFYHPYARPRDSYLPDIEYSYNGIPAPSRKRAQLSSGIVQKIHLDDIPLISKNDHDESDDFTWNSRVINDTVGIGEALVFAVGSRNSRDSGLGTSEEHTTVDPSYQVPAQVPKKNDATRPPHLMIQKTDHYSAHTFASSPLLHDQESGPDKLHRDSYSVPLMQATRTSNASLESSVLRSPRSISDPDDLEGFYDLFYDPNRPTQHMASGLNHVSASGALIGLRREAESELASLARQLGEELEQMTLEQGDSQYWCSSTGESQSSIARKRTGSTLEFVFEETSSPGSGTTGLSPLGQHTISPFQPSSAKIPEDIESSRTSSLIDPDKDGTGKYLCT